MAEDKLNRITGTASLKRFFNSKYIGAYSIDDGCEPILTIDSLWEGEVTLEAGRKENHVIVQFRERSVQGCEEVKPLVLNSTNRKTLKKLYGDNAAALEGKKIQIYIDPKVRDPQDGGWTEGLRIRPFKPEEKPAETVPPCADCGGEIKPGFGKSASGMAGYTETHYGVPLCADCAKKRKDAATAETAANETADAATAETAANETADAATETEEAL